MTEIMLTKLMPPEFGAGLLTRKRLLQSILNNKKSRILEICAPAGYGKTVLIQQLACELKKPMVWIQLDRYDNEPAHLVNCLIKGLQQYWPDLGTQTLQVIAHGNIAGKQSHLTAMTLVNALVHSKADPLLVFDDFHELTEPAVHTLVQELLEYFPHNIYVIIASRTALPLSLSRFHVAETAQFLNKDDLHFTREEIAALLTQQCGPQTDHTLTLTEDFTDGWPSALELVIKLQANEDMSVLNRNLVKKNPLYNYLATEILGKLPVVYQEFLLHSSVLEVLTTEKCNYLLEREDSQEFLTILDKQLLLLTPLAGKTNAYRCHHLFREFLLNQLGKKRSSLQRKAGQQAIMNRDIDSAVEYYLQSGFDSDTETILLEAGQKALSEGRWLTVSRWLEYLTEEQINQNPWLCYFQATVETYRGHLNEAERWIKPAAAAFNTITTTHSGLTECYLLQARILRCRGRYEKCLSLIEKASKLLTEGQAKHHFDLTLEKALCLALSGKMREAEKLLTNALLVSKKNKYVLAITYYAEALGHIYYQQGKHALALRSYQDALRYSADHSLPGYYIQDSIPYIYRDWGEMDKAMEWAQKSVQVKEKYRLVETLPSAYSALSYVYFELGEYEQVEKLIRKALDLHFEHGAERYFFLLNQILLSWCRFAQGHWVESRQLLKTTLTAAETRTDLICSLVQMMAGTVLALMGDFEEAKNILHRSELNLTAMNFKTRLCETYKALAYVYFKTNDIKQFHRYARKFLRLGAQMNFICNSLVPTADLLEPIFKYGLEYDIEVVYVHRMLVRLGQRSNELLIKMAGHPNPAVRQRVIAPLTELAGEIAMQTVEQLARDEISAVSFSARNYLQLTSKTKTADKSNLLTEKTTSDIGLEIRTFGALQLFIEKKELTNWRTRKTRELIALLIHFQEPSSKERLMEELWPEIAPQNGSALFRTTMHYLRRYLASEGLPGLICYQQNSYSLKPGVYQADFFIFEKLIYTAFQEEPLSEMNVGLLNKAIQLYRGDYMAEPPDYTWALPRQVRFKHLYIETLLALSKYYFSSHKYTRAQAYLLKLKEADPLCEPAHRLCLQVNAAIGNRKALIEEHRSYKILLLKETGLPPTLETKDLFNRLVVN